MITDRSGAIITVAELRCKLASGWVLTWTTQVIDGIGYWIAIDDGAKELRLVRIVECNAADIFPSN